MAKASLDLIDSMRELAEPARPITGRGVGYKLFAHGLIPSMEDQEMKRVYRLLKLAREQGMIPWHWIVDEGRSLERRQRWSDPDAFMDAVRRSYRRDFWDQQSVRVEVWSEKGTVRGVLAPVLDAYGVGFRVLHGFSGATTVYDVAQDNDGRRLIPLYVGDFDPSGMWMSEEDLPNRLEKYGGYHVSLRRVALLSEHLIGLPSFPASKKKTDTRYPWFVRNFGKQCCELDAMDPNDLRARVKDAIKQHIEPTAWNRCAVVNRAEQESLRTFFDKWRRAS